MAASFFDESFISGNIISSAFTINNRSSEIFSVRFNEDDQYIASCFGDGAIRIFNSNDGTVAFNLQNNSSLSLPVTSLRFRPSSSPSMTKNVLATVSASGLIQHWHIASGKCISTIHEKDNSINCIEFDDDGLKFITAGSDHIIRLYDESTKSHITDIKSSPYAHIPGHSNRIFSLKFLPQDSNVFISGGWDNNVVFWDIRTGTAVRSFYGPHICGDSIDIYHNQIVTGSWRHDNVLELWDITTGHKIKDISWNSTENNTNNTNFNTNNRENSKIADESKDSYSSSSSSSSSSSMLYTVRFSPNGQYIAAGGSHENEVKLFNTSLSSSSSTYEIVSSITGLSKPVFSIDFNHNSTQMIIAGGDSCIRSYNIKS